VTLAPRRSDHERRFSLRARRRCNGLPCVLGSTRRASHTTFCACSPVRSHADAVFVSSRFKRGTGDDKLGRGNVVDRRPSELLTVRKAAAAFPALRGVAATADAVHAGERLTQVLDRSRRQRRTSRGQQKCHKRSQNRQAAEKAGEHAKAPRTGVHGGKFARKRMNKTRGSLLGEEYRRPAGRRQRANRGKRRTPLTVNMSEVHHKGMRLVTLPLLADGPCVRSTSISNPRVSRSQTPCPNSSPPGRRALVRVFEVMRAIAWLSQVSPIRPRPSSARAALAPRADG